MPRLPVFLLMLFAAAHAACGASEKKVLFVDSYHSGYAWSDGVEAGVRQVLDSAGVDWKVFRMDSKRHPEEAFIRQSALQAKAFIEEYHPDVVIACDDNASKYLVMPYYKNTYLPFVFCGVNWDASVYGYPYRNATGMVETDFVELLVKQLRTYSKGQRVGSLAVDQMTEHRVVDFHRDKLGIEYRRSAFAKTFAEWKKAFLELQQQVDMLVLLSSAGIPDWNREEAIRFVQQNSKVPSGTIDIWMTPLAAVGLLKLPQEQGEWAARTALRILDGESPADILLVQNTENKLILNLDLVEKLKLKIDPRLNQAAEFVRCPPEAAECAKVPVEPR